MKAVFYMLRKTVKNAILDTIRHPVRLIMYLLLGGSMVYALVVSFFGTGTVNEAFTDARILNGAYLAILLFISVPIMLKGISTGTSFFGMSDVNNIFTAPISKKKILVYGVGRQLLSMLLLVVTFASYTGMVIRSFDIGVNNALLLVGGIMLMLLLVQIITMFIFCLSSGHSLRSSIIKYIIYLIPIYPLAVVITYLFSNGITVEHFYEAISLPILEYTPVAGWVHAIVFGILDQNTTQITVYSLILLMSVIVSLMVFAKIRLDYYEDVLGRAESWYEWRDNMRSGRMNDSMTMGDSKIKLRKQGIKHGKGASTIFFKHMVEGSRRSRFMFFNINTVVLLAITLLIGIGMKMAAGFLPTTVIYIAAVVICAYVQFFFSAVGDWVKELSKPYIFLIPDSAVKKLIMAGATSIIKPYVDGLVAFAAMFVVVGGNLLDAVLAVLVYGSFGSVYISANILAQRIVGMDGNRGVFITFYMSFIILLMLPGIVFGIVALSWFGSLMSFAMTVMGIPILIWNIIISFLIFLLCKNLLNNIE